MSIKMSPSVKLILICVACLVLTAMPAGASITEEVVQRSWERIAEAEGLEPSYINCEDDDQPNAWVYFESSEEFSVYVTRGLMEILDHEDEIAGVLAHELGHIQCEHYAQEDIGQEVGLSVLGAILGAQNSILGAISELAPILAESELSREQEVEADGYAAELLVQMGYDPWGLYRAMQAFKEQGFMLASDGFNSQPFTDKRLKHLSDKVQEIEQREGIVSEVPKSTTKGKATSASKAKRDPNQPRDWDSDWEKLKNSVQ